MQIDNQTIRKIAFLSRLKVEDDKIEETKAEVEKILEWGDQLQEVNTEGVEPLVSVNTNNLQMREDEITDGNIADKVTANAPMKEYGYFAVPKVIE